MKAWATGARVLGSSVGKSFFGFEIVRVSDAMSITQLAQDMVFYQWTNVE